VADPADADYEALFGRDPVQVQAGARNVPAPKRPAARPFRETEAKIAAAIADGKIPRSRTAHYRALAAAGDDLSVLDQLAGTPGLVLGGAATEDPEDAVYQALFGTRPGDGSQPISAAEVSATAALSEKELYEQIFGKEG
jgi:hypothetical protein